ncbi:MAG: 50S ribosomal protein L25 [Desulfobulbus propionicus]|nr:MAG: 50S ribosomal protein L25 [Desulfobulbus propionicus]
MLQVDLASKVRTVFGKGPMRQLRMQNITPAVVYSGGTTAMPLQFDAGQLFKQLLFIHGRNAVVTLTIEGDSKQERYALVQEIQKDPVTGTLIHVDFREIDLDRELDFTVPLEFTGTAKGVDLGGELIVNRTSIRLRGCPLDIPDMITAEITHLEQGGEGITYGDLELPEKVTMLDAAEITCVFVQ